MESEFLKALVLVFLVSALTVFLLQRFKVHPLVGFIAAGLLIRPEGLGIIKDTRDIEVFADIGVILLLFIVGIEFSKSKMTRSGKAIAAGAGQVVLTILVSTLIAYPFLENIRTAIFAGFVISMSSTAIVMKIMLERGEMDTPHGHLTTGILVFQDMFVVPLMLFLPVLAGTGIGPLAFSISTIKAVFIAVLVFTSARWIVPALLHQVVGTKSRELFNITLILVCLGIAFVTSKSGLSLALGAFLAGLVISESEYSFEAVSEMVPFKDIFLGLFFVSIGMLLDVQGMINNWPTILIASLAVFCIKIICTAIPVASIMSSRVAIITGIGLAQIGEFSFVLSASGRAMGIISDELYQIFLSTTVVTMVATPFLLNSAPSLSSWFMSWKPIKRLSRFKKDEVHVGRTSDHVIIIGFGLNGRTLAKTLRETSLPYIVLDMNSATVRAEKKKGQPIHYGDGTSREVLHSLGIQKARVLVVAISDAVSTRNIISLAKIVNPHIHVVVRTKYLSEVDALMAMGADEVIPEEFETSIEVFSRVLEHYNVPRNIIEDYIDSMRKDSYKAFRATSTHKKSLKSIHPLLSEIETETFYIKKGSQLSGQSIHELLTIIKGGVTIIAVQREGDVHYNPDNRFALKENDTVFLMGRREDINRTVEELESEDLLVHGRD